MGENGDRTSKLFSGWALLTDQDAVPEETLSMLKDLGVIVVEKRAGHLVEFLRMYS